jgi:bifunctional DNA-binding transcriptional regulator/antitoxin component of YhaV-PrlF toxin-antitoxin module
LNVADYAMRFTTTVKDTRIVIPAIIRQGLALRRGDFIEVTVEIVRRVKK